jgi:sterol desaturase/sphingolipid hydroxylase (fatty acid hydroxylase superfamily)
MVHHLEFYGPTMKMRTPSYRDRELDGIAGVGWEWIAPSLVLTVAELLVLGWLGLGLVTQAVFFSVGLLWSVVMFYGAHEAMHVTRPTAFVRRPLRRWFLHARRMHAIHHRAVDHSGRFLGNFGIISHLFDRLFGSYLRKVPQPQASAAASGKRTNA